MRTKIISINSGAVIVEQDCHRDGFPPELGRTTKTVYSVCRDGRVRVRYGDGAERVYRDLRSTPENLADTVRALRRRETDAARRCWGWPIKVIWGLRWSETMPWHG